MSTFIRDAGSQASAAGKRVGHRSSLFARNSYAGGGYDRRMRCSRQWIHADMACYFSAACQCSS